MTNLEQTLKHTLGLRGEENDSVGEVMHYRSLYEQPESHSATINHDEGRMGPFPAGT